MQYQLTELEAYDAMQRFLRAYWERCGRAERDVSVLLTDITRNTDLNLGPGDPAQWGDWLEAVAAIKDRAK